MLSVDEIITYIILGCYFILIFISFKIMQKAEMFRDMLRRALDTLYTLGYTSKDENTRTLVLNLYNELVTLLPKEPPKKIVNNLLKNLKTKK